MERVLLDQGWEYRKGFLDMASTAEDGKGILVDLPHDAMIEGDVSEDAPGRFDMGYYKGSLINYTKKIMIPDKWKDDCVGLYFDGAMSNATVDINGYKVAAHHYGYAPFYVDLTDRVTFGEYNRITVNLNTTMNENSRWYTGTGLFRSVELCHSPRIHVAHDGIFMYTKEIGDVTCTDDVLTADYALIDAKVMIENTSYTNSIVDVILEIAEESGELVKSVKSSIYVAKGTSEPASFSFAIDDPKLWDAEHPNLYTVTAKVQDAGEYRTHLIPKEDGAVDKAVTLFGIRTISVDSRRGLRINGKSIKLKGGCLHHDNGLIGTASLFETEARKIKKLKEVGFNAIRTSHNPPSKVLIEACDRLGMYVLDEAFDAWNMAKRSGDYSQYFDADWEKDLTSFVTRDRNSPAVIMWSTGNEIPERGGLSDGYKVASMLAAKVKSLDPSRPVCNAVCSMWSGLDDELASSQNHQQNASARGESLLWENVTLPFTNGLDIVGYNYLEGLYEKDHEIFPDRVILGSENFPKEIGFRWPFIEEHPYVIGDFTWTAWDYIGEAGIGKAVYVDENDPKAPKNPWEVMPYTSSPYPWRCANDADFDITGRLLPQGQYRSIAWHSDKTYVYSKHPDTFGKKEICSMWGFPYVDKNWNYKGYEGKDIEIVVFSSADEVEVLVNGKSIGVKRTDLNDRFPNCAVFETVYEEGVVEAISYKLGAEAVSGSCNNDNNDSYINTDRNTDKDVARVVISRDTLETTKVPAAIRLVPEKTSLKADGHDVSYIGIEIVDEDGAVVPDAEVSITASISGKAKLSGLGTGNPKTEENYTDNITTTYKGMAMAVLRSGYEKGEATLSIESQGFLKKEIKITLE